MKKVKETPDIKNELIEFSKNNTIEKPETGVIVVAKPVVDRTAAAKKRPGLSLGKKKFTLTHGLDKDDGEEKKVEEPEAVEVVAPKSNKYKAGLVRLFLSKVTFVHKNRFKSGWFTLLKFMKEVRTNDKLRDELIKFSAENKLVKPDTGVIVVA